MLTFQSNFEQKLRLLFLAVFVTIIVLIATSFYIFVSVTSTQTDVIDDHVKDVLLLKDTEILIEQMVSRSRAYLLTGEVRFWEGVKENNKQFSIILDALKESVAGDARGKILVAGIESAEQRHSESSDKLMGLRNGGSNMNLVLKIFDEDVKPKRDAVSAVLQIAAKYENEQLKNAQANAEKTRQWGLVFLIAAGALSLLFGIFLYRLLSKALKQKRKIEEELHSIEEVSKQATSLTGMGVFDHDQRNDTIHWSPLSRNICGWGPDESVTLPQWIEHIPMEDRGAIGAEIQRAHDPAGNGVYEVEHRINRRDGGVRWVKIKSQTFFDGEGTDRVPVRTIGAMLDTTAIKEREASLIETKGFVEKILNVSPVVISIFDFNLQKTTFVSQRVINILGFTQEEIQSFDSIIQKIVHPEDIAKVTENHEKLKRLPHGEASSFNVRLLHNDGSYHYFLVTDTAFKRNENGVVTQIVSAVSDITDQKKLELSLRKTTDDLAKEKLKLERSNKELEQFASIAAHDLRSPLTSMLGWVGMLNRLVPKPRDEKIDQAIDFISLNTKKADALIGDLLEVARVNVSNQVEAVDLNKSVSNLLAVLKQPIENSGARIHCDPLPTVTARASQLESVFSNFIRNALTYRDKTRTPDISIGCRKILDYYEFSIKDNGIGIAPEFTDRIFEMFQRLHGEKEFSGTGIGLAFCKKVVELHGGKIWVNSVPGEGSTFYFTYPINYGGG